MRFMQSLEKKSQVPHSIAAGVKIKLLVYQKESRLIDVLHHTREING